MLGQIAPTRGDHQKKSGTSFLSVVTPIFNESENVLILIDRIRKIMETMKGSYEVICVNDGSTDNSLALLEQEAGKDSRIKIVNFSRNFGHQVAITAGLEFAGGDAVIVMDSDLQDPPELIKEFVEKWNEGFDVVYAIRKKRKGVSWFKKSAYLLFYRLLRYLTKVDIPVDTGDFRLMDRRVVHTFLSLPERHRFVRGMIAWVGFRQLGIEYDRDPRLKGVPKYTFLKLLRLALDGITSFSYVPLQLSAYLGFACSFISCILIVITVYAKIFAKPYIIEGWTSTFVTGLFLGGVQLSMIGLLGEYLGRMHDEVKKRPVYIVQSLTNMDSHSKSS